MSDLAFPTGRDSATFRDKGTEVPSLSRDKGTTGQAKNLAKGRDRPGQSKSGTGRAGTAKIRDGTRDKMGQKDVQKHCNDGTSVPLSRKVALSRPVGNHSGNCRSYQR